MRTLLHGPVHGANGADGVLVEGDVITWVGHGRPPARPDDEILVPEGGVIAPGFIDLQVNGYAGHDAASGADAIAAVSNALPASGCTAPASSSPPDTRAPTSSRAARRSPPVFDSRPTSTTPCRRSITAVLASRSRSCWIRVSRWA